MNRIVSAAAESTGLQEATYEDAAGYSRHRIRPYSFRYGFGDRMKSKVDPECLQRLMGHKSATTTLEYYNSTSEEELVAAGAIVPDP